MTTNATIETLSYVKTTAETGSSKSYADKSDNFENFLKSANKTYSKEEMSSASNVADASAEKKKTQDSINNKANKRADSNDKNFENKTETDYKNQTESAENNEVKNETVNNAENKNVENSNTQKNTKSEAEPETDTTNSTSVKEDTTDLSTVENEDGSDKIALNLKDLEALAKKLGKNPSEVLPAEILADAKATAAAAAVLAEKTVTNQVGAEIPTQDIANAENENPDATAEVKKQPQTAIQSSEIAPVEINISATAEKIVETLPQKTNTENSNIPNNLNTENNGLVQAEQNKSAVGSGIANLAKQLNDVITNQPNQPVNKTTIQTQTQQALSNLKIEPQNTTPQATQATPTEAVTAQDSNVQTPVIAANTELVAAEANLNPAANATNIKQDTLDALNKTSLTQDIVDGTNAKVVSVSTSTSSDSSNSNNLLNKQNAEEQAIKLSLQPTVDTNNLQTGTDTNVQNFSKTLETAQTQTHQQAHVPKELSKTEIMAQINNQLNKMGAEEGTTKINIILKPENLGKINLELITTKEGLTAKMTTDNPQVKELLDKSLDSLKESLGSQGVNVNNVTVKVQETTKQDTMFAFDGQQGHKNQETPDNKNTSGSEFSSSEEFEDTSEITETLIEPERSVSMSTHSGQVDYKV